MKGGKQGFPRHEVSDKQEVLFEDVSPSTALSIRQLDAWFSECKHVCIPDLEDFIAQIKKRQQGLSMSHTTPGVCQKVPGFRHARTKGPFDLF